MIYRSPIAVETKNFDKGSQEDHYKHIYETVLVGLYRTCAEDGTFLRANQTAAEILGFKSADELINKVKAAELYPVERRAQLLELLNKHGEIKEFEIHLKRLDGSERDILISSKLYKEQGFIEGVIVDITDRKRIEEALRRSEERFQQVVDNAEEWVWEVNTEGLYIYSSPVVERLLGYKPEELINKKHFYDLFVPEKQKQLKETAFETFERRLSFKHFINANLHKDGKVVWLSTSGVPIINQKGEFEGYRGVDIDITQQKKDREELLRVVTELERKNKELEEFSYTVSHDLRSPVITIKGFLDLLAGSVEKGAKEEALGYLERVSMAAEHINRLITDISELAKLGRMPIRMTTVSMTELAREAAWHTEGITNSIEAKLSIQSNMPAINADRGRMVEVLVNLIENAVKYRAPDRRLEICIGHRKHKGRNCFFISDNGVGITREAQKEIFKVFKKLDPDSEGSGIGLAIVKRIIQMHNGDIWVESKPGSGSTFFFTLGD